MWGRSASASTGATVAHDDHARPRPPRRRPDAGRAPLAGVVEQLPDGTAPEPLVARHGDPARCHGQDIEPPRPEPARGCSATATSSLHEQVEPQGSTQRHRPALAPGQLGQVAHNVGQLLAAARGRRRRARAGPRRLKARPPGGSPRGSCAGWSGAYSSSCEASSTNWALGPAG